MQHIPPKAAILFLRILVRAQALSRGSGAFGGPSRRSGSGRLARSGSLDGALKPKQMHLELELVAIGVGLQFVELEEGRKVQFCMLYADAAVQGISLQRVSHETVRRCCPFSRGYCPLLQISEPSATGTSSTLPTIS